MQITVRITWRRLILGGLLAALLMSIVTVRLAYPAPNTVIASRNSIRARLAIPKGVREFPVEKYANPKDWFVYRRPTPPGSWNSWTLQIACIGNDANKWTLAFRKYLGELGKYIERGGDATFTGQEQRFYLRGDSGEAVDVRMVNLEGNLHITFQYRKVLGRSKFWRTKFGRYIAAVLLKLRTPSDAITRVS